ncbi:mitochondrial import protein Pam17-domain-containing protein [Coniochaeta sp. 2T2.1]|nr:mitochondrial import protein Pam17-domain-containing protein [Coniochaeta sp. 2T2.1]
MLTSTTTSMLRVGVGRPAIQSGLLLRSSQVCPYSTTFKAAAPLAVSNTRRTSQTPSCTTPKQQPSALIRQLSSSAPLSRPQGSDHDADAAAAAQVAAKSAARTAANPSDEPPLDWNTFFRLRKTRRRWQLLFSVSSSLAAGTAGALVLTTGAADALVSQVPLDPMITLGLMVFASAALGWLAGPSLGSQVFYAINRRYKNQMTVKEVQFFARVKKNRVDPSNSSAGNPVPDFYGEKISSVAGYRQWLKDQRAFNKKRTTFV